jgi:hypothetical protein
MVKKGGGMPYSKSCRDGTRRCARRKMVEVYLNTKTGMPEVEIATSKTGADNPYLINSGETIAKTVEQLFKDGKLGQNRSDVIRQYKKARPSSSNQNGKLALEIYRRSPAGQENLRRAQEKLQQWRCMTKEAKIHWLKRKSDIADEHRNGKKPLPKGATKEMKKERRQKLQQDYNRAWDIIVSNPNNFQDQATLAAKRELREYAKAKHAKAKGLPPPIPGTYTDKQGRFHRIDPNASCGGNSQISFGRVAPRIRWNEGSSMDVGM